MYIVLEHSLLPEVNAPQFVTACTKTMWYHHRVNTYMLRRVFRASHNIYFPVVVAFYSNSETHRHVDFFLLLYLENAENQIILRMWDPLLMYSDMCKTNSGFIRGTLHPCPCTESEKWAKAPPSPLLHCLQLFISNIFIHLDAQNILSMPLALVLLSISMAQIYILSIQMDEHL